MRRTERFPVAGCNSLWQIYRTVSFWKVFRNTAVILVARYLPFIQLKLLLYRLLGMRIGNFTSFAFEVTPDLLFPELIQIGEDCVIGYHTTLLCHEYLVREYRIGKIEIGNQVMIGSSSIVLPGISIGDRAIISAGSLVNRDIPADCFAGGNPIQILSVKPRE
ncbi:MAG: acetyltransferase [Bacilli bacterium]|nr:acetyltransferase [Bacilli bacterium]